MWHLGFRGRDIDLPTGKDGIEGAADVATLDTSAMCPRCHYGVVQVGPLRIPASQLSRCTGFVQIISGITTILVDGELIEKLGSQMWHGVELRKVTQTGKGVKGKDWFQILPMRTLPATMFFNYYRIIRTCSECKKHIGLENVRVLLWMITFSIQHIITRWNMRTYQNGFSLTLHL